MLVNKSGFIVFDNGKDYLYVLRTNNYPAILVECAFIDNKSDMDKLNTAEKVKT
ncbi:N-acetylmuramoyl-L-alanine amidase, partial [Clostridioides difficile]